MKKLGFGCMRLPMKNDEVDLLHFTEMVDRFIEEGFVYFDTAHGYINGKSETAIKACLTSRYNRDEYILTNKLTDSYFSKQEDIIPFFNKQLKLCGVDYFDYYLMHSQNAKNFLKFKQCRAYETALKLKVSGKIKHFGISFHDTAEVLDKILTEYPQIEVVQIQLNYLDYEDNGVQSKLCLEVCEKHNKPVIVMEPVKGGNLVKLPLEAEELFKTLNNGSNASYAIRFAAGFSPVIMVLSGMSDLNQLEDNMSYMKNFIPLSEEESKVIKQVVSIFQKQNMISCTGCKYCVVGCPKKISIPDLFSDMNAKTMFNDWNSSFYYHIHTNNKGKASDCSSCGKCEQICPQKLPIRNYLKEVAKTFENK